MSYGRAYIVKGIEEYITILQKDYKPFLSRDFMSYCFIFPLKKN